MQKTKNGMMITHLTQVDNMGKLKIIYEYLLGRTQILVIRKEPTEGDSITVGKMKAVFKEEKHAQM